MVKSGGTLILNSLRAIEDDCMKQFFEDFIDRIFEGNPLIGIPTIFIVVVIGIPFMAIYIALMIPIGIFGFFGNLIYTLVSYVKDHHQPME